MANRNPQEPRRDNPGQGQPGNTNRPEQNRQDRGGEQGAQRQNQGQPANPNRPREEQGQQGRQNR